jgi:DNA repair protein RecO (recombination protein O)
MQKSSKLNGIVIKRKNYGEADKIVTLLTKEKGKIQTIAKGIRKIKSRKAPHLELFNQISTFVFKGRNFHIITEVESKNTYPFLKKDLKRVVSAYKIVEQIDKLCPEEETYPQVYVLLVDTLEKLNEPECKIEYQLENFSGRLLKILGYLPVEENMPYKLLEAFIEKTIERKLKSKGLDYAI